MGFEGNYRSEEGKKRKVNEGGGKKRNVASLPFPSGSGKTTLSASGMLLPDTLYNTELAKCIWDSDSGQNFMLMLSSLALQSLLQARKSMDGSSVVGSVANCYPPKSSDRALLMADIRCLPGMEGGPVFGDQNTLVGILIRPLRQTNNDAEIQLVILWEAIASACSDLQLKEPQIAEKGIHINEGNLNAVGNRLFSNSNGSNGLCCYDDDHPNSCVVLNDLGLILTNAHLLEPWRFGKTTVSGTKTEASFFPPEESASPEGKGFNRYQKSSMPPFSLNIIVKSSVADEQKDKLSPIVVDFAQPSLGSNAYVIGHGLLAPRCGFSPFVCSGVVAKVVKAEMLLYYKSVLPGVSQFPAMLETTAAVHPGGSGGAVVNSDGCLIGLLQDMQEFSPLQNLDQPNEHLSSVWELMPPLSPNTGPLPNLPQPLLEANNNKEGKGSRFAKFIAERNELLKRSAQFGIMNCCSIWQNELLKWSAQLLKGKTP
ncbi:hypothetical protein CRYUN_Cryun31cG0031600 [Craigia yunnanensis]